MKKFFVIIAIALTAVSCEIEKFPYDSVASEQIFEGEGTLEAATLGNYALLKGTANGGGFMPQWHRLAEYPGDNVSLSGTTTDALFYTYNYNNTPTSYRINELWSTGFKAIVGTNSIIEIATEGESPELDQLLGENYYLRAFVYFQLSNVFGRPYVQGRENLSVPLKLSTDVDEQPDRATVGEVYDQVVSDLLKAEELMSINKSHSYATKEAAQALLSRVYLYMEMNQEAIAYADKVINSGRFSLVSTSNLPTYFQMNPDDNPETIFAFKYLEETDYNHGWYTIGSLYANIQGAGWGEMYASWPYLNLLWENPNDQRLGFIDPQYLTDAEGNKFPAVYWVDEDTDRYIFRRTSEQGGTITFDNDGTQTTVQSEVDEDGITRYYFDNGSERQYVIKDFDMAKRNGYPKFFILKASLQEEVPHLYSPIVSRLSEMFLNKAEAYAKMGDTDTALENVNRVRSRAGIPTYDGVEDFEEGESLLNVVLKERQLEFAYEGHRKYDVFRNNYTMDRDYPGTHLNGNNPFYEIPPTADRVIEFIPQPQINAQPTLIQND